MQKGWILVALLGLGLAGLDGCSANAREKAEKAGDEQEVKVTLDQVPPAVKATLQKEASGGQITDIAKETKNGKTAYEADVTLGGKPYEIKVAQDGSLLKKELEDKKDEKEEREEKGGR